jgi:hypothetical protein
MMLEIPCHLPRPTHLLPDIHARYAHASFVNRYGHVQHRNINETAYQAADAVKWPARANPLAQSPPHTFMCA